MKRIQIYIDEPLDEVLAKEASSRGTSKAALIRDAAAREYGRGASPEAGGWDLLLGLAGDAQPVNDIDELLYGPGR